MSNFNPLDRAKIPTHRSSFDLSSKKLFTAKICEILPCYWQLAIPDNTYRISSDWFTRTVPVNTAAYRDWETDRKSTRLNSSHITRSRMPSSA